MMASKSFLLVLVALFAVQGGIADAKFQLPQTYDSLLEKFIEIINKVLKEIDAQIDEVVAKLPELKKQLNEAALKVTDTIQDSVQQVLDDGLKLVDDLVANAESQGINVDLCVVDRREKLHEIGTAIVTDTASCVRTNVAQGDAALDLAIKQIQSINNAINVLQKEFSDCGTDADCQWTVLGKAAKLLQKLPSDIKNFLDQAKYKIERIIEDFGLCLSKSQDKIEKEIQPLLNEILNCIKDKIEGGRIEPRDLQTTYDLFDQALTIFKALQEKVTGILQDVLNKIPELVASLRGTADKVLNSASDTVKVVVNKGLEEINKLVAIADEKGIDVIGCLGTIKEDVNDLAEQAIDATKVCVANNLDIVENYINDTLLVTLQESLDVVNSLSDEIMACNKQKLCLIKVITKLGVEGAKIPIKMAEAWTKANALVVKMNVQIGICLTTNTYKLSSQIIPMVGTVVGCIKDTIFNNDGQF